MANSPSDATHTDAHLTISLAVLQQAGIVLLGKPIEETLPVIPEAAFREALVQSLRGGACSLAARSDLIYI